MNEVLIAAIASAAGGTVAWLWRGTLAGATLVLREQHLAEKVRDLDSLKAEHARDLETLRGESAGRVAAEAPALSSIPSNGNER